MYLSQGLEVEVQKLIAKHRADLENAQDKAAADMAKQLDVLRQQHQEDIRQLRDRLAKVCCKSSWSAPTCQLWPGTHVSVLQMCYDCIIHACNAHYG